MDGIISEILKCSGECLFEWLRRVCNVCVLEEQVQNGSMRLIIVPMYKGNCGRSDHENYKRISLLSIPSKGH